MPRYYFDLDDGKQFRSDNEGSELANDEAARQEAIRTLAEVAKDVLPNDGQQLDMFIHVRNSDGKHLLQVMLNFAARPLS